MRPGGRAAFAISLLLTAILRGQVSVLTWHNDQARTGQNLAETVLTPLNVSTTSVFGRLFTIPVDGKVDAQPLYVPSLAIPQQGAHNVLYVMTENDSAYAFDADSGAQLWHAAVTLPGETPSDDRGCGQVTPEIGITSTPVIDLQRGPHGTIYLIAMSKDASGNYYQRLHALDLTSGAEEFNGPMLIAATWPGSGAEGANGTLTFDPKQHKERAALLLDNGVVYTSWSSHCDNPPYTSWVMGYNETTLAQVSLLNLEPNGSDGGLWGAGAGPAADAAGSIYVMLGNGAFETTLNGGGFPSGGDYGNAFVRIAVQNGSLAVADYFDMFNTVAESNSDLDLGSGGMLLMPPVDDAQGNSRSLLVGAGKDANIYVLDRTNMGKFNPSQNLIYQDVTGAIGGVFSTPAWFNGTLYYGAVGDYIKAFAFNNGLFGATPTSQSPTAFGYPGATPAISASGTANAIVWAAENTDPATLHAYDATNLATELYNSNMAAGGRDHFGTGNKFIVPTIVNGKVYVGTTAGVGVFGLLCTGALSPDVHVAAGGGGGSVTVTAAAGCSWTAQSNTGFVSLTSAAGGTGSGAVSYSVAANAGAARVGTLSIAGKTFTVSQDGVALAFIPITPCRVVDTRYANGAFGSPSLAGGSARSFTIPSGSCTIPTIAAAYSLNVTAVPQGTLDYLSVWPGGQPQPVVSTLNSVDGRIKANAAIIAAGANGAVNVYATNITDLALDIDGYFVAATTPGALAFYSLRPCRIADTRYASFGSLGPPSLIAGQSRSFDVLSSPCSVPSTAQAYSLNFTVVPPGGVPVNYITTYPTGATQPLASTLNDMTGTIVANAAIVPAGTGGAVSVYSYSATDLIIDIDGYFAPPGTGGLSLYNLTPCRVLDSRLPSGTAPFTGEKDVGVSGSACAPPATAQAYVFNATVVPPGPMNYLTLWPQGGTQPVVSTLNALDGAITSNMAIVPTTNGSISSYVYVPSTTYLVLDIFGYFAP
jgi:hypothetical protein